MCGRFASFREAQELADAFAITHVADDARELPPSWNVAPTDPVRVVVEREHEGTARRTLQVARWGLVPGWAEDPSIGTRMINARAETLADKPAFRRALAARRCLVPAEGYFEWQRRPGADGGRPTKQPYWIHPADDRPIAFAGLYEFWRDPDRAEDDPLRWLVTTTVITTTADSADPLLGPIHDRRPVVLDPATWDAWLDPDARDGTTAAALLREPGTPLVPTAVSTAVGNVTNNGPELIRPL